MRVHPRALRSYSWYLRVMFARQKSRFGAVLDAALLWARSPRLYLTISLLYSAVDRRSSPIPPALRSLVMVRVSQINGCPFCVDLNSAILLERNTGADKIDSLADWRSSPAYDEMERLALEYAEAMTRTDAGVEQALFERLQGGFDDDAIIELTALIAFQNLSSKFNSALDVAPQGFCRLPQDMKAATSA